MAGFLDQNTDRTSVFNRIFQSLSKLGNLGMEYDDMVIRNSQAIGRTESQFFNQEDVGYTDNAAFRWTTNYQDIKTRKYIAYFDKDYPSKISFLRKFSLNGEIEFILDTICDEAIVSDDKNFIAYPTIDSSDLNDKVVDAVADNFKKIYALLGFQNGITAWQYFRKFLIEGFLAFEIVYDDKAKNIVGFKELDPTSLEPKTTQNPDGTFKQIWVQYPNDNNMRRVLTNEQLIYISYAKGNTISRVSYIERLIRSYNILRIMENTRIIWNVMNASYRLKFIIPVGSQSPQKALNTLGQLMSMYKEEIEIDDNSGEMTINGRPKIQFYKNYMFPEKNGQSPTIDTLNPSGPDFNVMESVSYFFNRLKMDSKIPYARFAFRGAQASNYSIGIDQLERDEIRFEKFLSRLRATFQEIMMKPLYLQMILDFPQLKRDREFKSNLALVFTRENQFQEFAELANLTKRVAFINSMTELQQTVGDQPEAYFSKDFLIRRFLGLSPDEYNENNKFKKAEEIIAKKAAEKAAQGEGSEEGGGLGF
jgi:hypothetical protein